MWNRCRNSLQLNLLIAIFFTSTQTQPAQGYNQGIGQGTTSQMPAASVCSPAEPGAAPSQSRILHP